MVLACVAVLVENEEMGTELVCSVDLLVYVPAMEPAC